MNPYPPSPVHYAIGGETMTGGEIWVGTIAELVTALIDRRSNGTLPVTGPLRAASREALGTAIAAERQLELVNRAIQRGEFSYDRLIDEELELLLHARGEIDLAGCEWRVVEVPLIVIRSIALPAVPSGHVVVVDVTSDRRLIASLVGTGLLAAGRLDSTGTVREHGRQ
ncbi:hypothetical protein [Frigoribacterium sp. UYMn621]|uniref:hypothetical protein n=1 Tax=Frigoribacterium sp. UYMn621 TaxID=3156343 RepID=UPI00339350FF